MKHAKKVAPGDTNPTGLRAPPPPGQARHAVKAAAVAKAAIGHQRMEGAPHGSRWMPLASQHGSEALPQRCKLPFYPARMAIGGFAITVVIGYFTLYTNKKKNDAALDVAKVITGAAVPENTRRPN